MFDRRVLHHSPVFLFKCLHFGRVKAEDDFPLREGTIAERKTFLLHKKDGSGDRQQF